MVLAFENLTQELNKSTPSLRLQLVRTIQFQLKAVASKASMSRGQLFGTMKRMCLVTVSTPFECLLLVQLPLYYNQSSTPADRC